LDVSRFVSCAGYPGFSRGRSTVQRLIRVSVGSAFSNAELACLQKRRSLWLYVTETGGGAAVPGMPVVAALFTAFTLTEFAVT
jgi:hypothetical protein